MQSNQFGHDRVPMQQSRIDAGSFRQASVMTGANPVSPSRESFQSTSRQVNPGSIPNRASSNQHFFSSTARQNPSFQAGRNESTFNRGGSPTGNVSRGPSSEQGQRGFSPPAAQQSQSIQSSRPGWRTFTAPSGQQGQSNGGRTFGSQGAPQSRSYNTQPSAPPRQYENNSRGSYNGGGSSRPTLNMRQPVVTPRGGGSYPAARTTQSAPSGGGYRGAPSGGGSHGGNSGGGSHGGSSGGGGHSHH